MRKNKSLAEEVIEVVAPIIASHKPKLDSDEI